MNVDKILFTPASVFIGFSFLCAEKVSLHRFLLSQSLNQYCLLLSVLEDIEGTKDPLTVKGQTEQFLQVTAFNAD